jgi:hypothetical protein
MGYPDSVTMFLIFLTRFSSVPHRASDSLLPDEFNIRPSHISLLTLSIHWSPQ